MAPARTRPSVDDDEPLPTLSATRARRMSAREARLASHARSPSRSPSPSPPRDLIGRGDGGAGSSSQQTQLCPACQLPLDRCPGAALARASPPASCSVCASPLATGTVPYPEAASEPAETWTPPGFPLADSISDDDGHPLTWGRVKDAHDWLTRHASCAAAHGLDDASGYDSDGDRCPCTWHPVAVEERDSHLRACRDWPGPICGPCWAASCECGFVFDAAHDAHSRWPSGRLCCAGCAP